MDAKRPDFVDLGILRYAINFITCADDGFVVFEKRTIGINVQEYEDDMRSALLHEILHAIFTEYCLLGPDKDDEEEELITRLEPLFFEFLKRNPHVVKYLAALDHEEPKKQPPGNKTPI